MDNITLKIDGREYAAQCSLGTTLEDFLTQVGPLVGLDSVTGFCTQQGAPVVAEYTLVHRWNGRELFSQSKAQALEVVPAVTPEQLFSTV